MSSKFNLRHLLHPIIQAPMSGISTPAMAAAVSKSGGLGSFGFAYATPDDIWNNIATAKSLNAQHLNANFFIFSSINDDLVKNLAPRVVSHLEQFPYSDKHTRSLLHAPYVPNLKEQLEPIWESRPEVLTFHFGIPDKRVLKMAQDYKISVGITATNIDEAIAIEQSGADFIIAQGMEAGGHMGTFGTDPLPCRLQSVSSLVHAIRTHDITKNMQVVAAGGIMDGNDMHTMMHPPHEGKVGADLVQLGTAFLATDESQASIAFKQQLYAKADREAVLTSAFSGRYARAISNDFVEGWGSMDTLPFPVQNTMTTGMRKQAAEYNDAEYLSMYAGVNYRRCRHIAVEKLMELLVEEYHQCRVRQYVGADVDN